MKENDRTHVRTRSAVKVVRLIPLKLEVLNSAPPARGCIWIALVTTGHNGFRHCTTLPRYSRIHPICTHGAINDDVRFIASEFKSTRTGCTRAQIGNPSGWHLKWASTNQAGHSRLVWASSAVKDRNNNHHTQLEPKNLLNKTN